MNPPAITLPAVERATLTTAELAKLLRRTAKTIYENIEQISAQLPRAPLMFGPEAAWPVVDLVEGGLVGFARDGSPLVESVELAALTTPQLATFLGFSEAYIVANADQFIAQLPRPPIVIGRSTFWPIDDLVAAGLIRRADAALGWQR